MLPTLTPGGNTQVLNEIMALNSASQLKKDDLLLHVVQLFSILHCGPDIVKESVTEFIP